MKLLLLKYISQYHSTPDLSPDGHQGDHGAAPQSPEMARRLCSTVVATARPGRAPPYDRSWRSARFVDSNQGQDARRLRSDGSGGELDTHQALAGLRRCRQPV